MSKLLRKRADKLLKVKKMTVDVIRWRLGRWEWSVCGSVGLDDCIVLVYCCLNKLIYEVYQIVVLSLTFANFFNQNTQPNTLYFQLFNPIKKSKLSFIYIT